MSRFYGAGAGAYGGPRLGGSFGGGGGVVTDIGVPVALGQTTQGLTQATVAHTTTAGVTAGDTIVVLTHANSTGTTLSSVTDSAGNTYAINVSKLHTGGVTLQLHIATCLNATALPLGGTITATYGASVSQKSLGACVVSGVAPANAFDRSSSADGSSGTWSSGETATLQQRGEIAFGGAVIGGTAVSEPVGTWTEVFDYTTGSRRLVLQYLRVSTSAALTASGTTTSAGWVGLIATYKGEVL